MSRKNVDSIFPLAPSQLGIFYESLAADAPGLHVEQAVAAVEGELDIDAFSHAWQEVVACHPMLRTGFVGRELDRPLQVVFRKVDARVRVLDWRDRPQRIMDDEVAAFADQDRRAGFDLAVAPLMRMSVIRTGARAARLIWTHHHILMDGWCISVLLGDLFRAYTSLHRGQTPQLPAPRPFRDYVRWIGARDRGRLESFWAERLRGIVLPTPLGRADISNPADELVSGEGQGEHIAWLSEDRRVALDRMARALQITPSTLVRAAWGLLLSRYSGHDDVVFGMTVSGRPPELDGVESMIGLFSTTLPMRVRVEPQVRLESWLAELGTLQQQELEHAYCAAGEIHGCSEVPGHMPLYDSVVVVENYPVDVSSLAVPGLEFDLASTRTSGARTTRALALLITPAPDRGIELQIVHDRTRLGDADVSRIPAHLDAVLQRLLGSTASATLDQLRADIARAVPEHEIPRVSMRQRQTGLDTDEAPGVTPMGPLEELVAGVWAEVLGLDSVGARTSFLDHGGHSLLATQIIARLGEAMGMSLPLRWLFEHPTVAGLAARIEGAQRHNQDAPPPPVVPVPRDAPLPLAFTQERVWFVDGLGEGARRAYIEQGAVRLSGRLEVDLLIRCLAALHDRHEALRTIFAEVDGRPVQIITPPLRATVQAGPDIAAAAVAALPRDVFEISEVTSGVAVSAADARAAVLRVAAEEAARAFDIRTGPLFRARLIRLAQDEHVLVLSIHHIITDGWSHAIFFAELGALYRALAAGQPSPLEPLPVQFADYAAWERRLLEGPHLDQALAYWRERLAGAPERSTIPTDRPRPALQRHLGASVSRTLTGELRRAVVELGRARGATLFMTVLAAFEVLLSRYSGQEDLVVGTPIAGRNRSELERVFGFFVKTLVLRTDLSGDPSFVELLGRVRDSALQAYAHQEAPFDKLVEVLTPSRTLGQNPLFQVFVNMLSHPPVALELGDLRVEELALPQTGSMFDMTLYIRDSGTELRFDLVYDRDLYTENRMQTVLVHLEDLLAQVAADPERPISACALGDPSGVLPDPEAALVTHDEVTVPAFLQHHDTGGDAIVDRHGRYARRDVDAQAESLASWLIDAGLQPGEVVAVYGYRSAALVAALLGVLRAGGAFLVLDPAYPVERLRRHVILARPRIWLQLAEAGEPGAELLDAECAPALRLTVPRLEDAIRALSPGDRSRAAPPMPSDADARAYVTFTSGTTGDAKGVEGTHRPLVHFLSWYERTLEVSARDRFCLLGGLAHDPMLRDVLVPLRLGATLCIPSPADLDSGDRLLAFLAEHEVTVIHITPALAQLLATASAGLLSRLRYVCFGGDVLTEATVQAVQRLAPGATVLNFYGATETPQAMSWHLVARPGEPAFGHEGGIIPIGRGIDDVQTLIRDRAGRRAGLFEIGEIAVRTPYLARYMDEDREPRRFVFDSCGGVYHTGDFGYYRGDGAVVFLGRRDRQIKIRGYRVELAEIERALLGHDRVARVLITARGSSEHPQENRLIAYYTGEPIAAHDLRAFLQARVPGFMIPAHFVHLDAIPLTPTGKPDMTALPDFARQPPAQASAPPRDAVERALCEIWENILGPVEGSRVGIFDDFFALGGHSLAAARVASRIHQRLGVSLSITAMFEHRTVERLARLIRETAIIGFTPIHAAARAPEQSAPLSDAQRRLWVLDQMSRDLVAYNMSDAILIEGPLDQSSLEAALAALVARHEILRTIFVIEQGEPRQRVLPPDGFRCELVDVAGDADPLARVRALARDHANTRFRLDREPPFRVTLVHLGQDRHALLICVHHIIADRWSMGVLQRDFVRAYECAVAGQPLDLEPLHIQYCDYAAWQAERLESEDMGEHLAYWRRALGDTVDLEPLELPLDFPRPPVKDYQGATVSTRLDPGESAAVRQLAQRLGTSPFMILVSLVKVLLHRYTGQHDIAVGVPVHGRDHIDLEDQVGCYVNMLVLRDRIAAGQPFVDLVRGVRAVATQAYAHQAYPFDRLVDALQVPREPSRSPLVDVVVVLQEQRGSGLTLSGLSMTPLFAAADQSATTSKFDLTFAFEEASDQFDVHIEYATSLFSEGRIRRMAEHFRQALASAAANPGQAVEALDLLADGERDLVIGSWNDTSACYPHQQTLIDLVEQQADISPDAIAVVFEQRTITYAELDRESSRLARCLRLEHGVGRGDLVPVIMERSEHIIVAFLAILKAGAAYVPIEPGYPGDRIGHMLAAIAARVIVTEAGCRAIVEAAQKIDSIASTCATIVDAHAARSDDSARLESSARPDDVAYVIFTSGSTGRPKGCVVTHRNAVRLLHNDRFPFDFGADDVWIAVHSFSFDFTIWETYGALTRGARVVIAPRQQVRDVTALHGLIRRHRVTVLNQTPAAFYNLIEVERHAASHDLDQHLRHVIFGGDRLEPAHLAPWVRIYPLDRVRLCNMYGITETTVHVTAGFLTDADVFGQSGRSPIGVPLPETRVYVCDAAMRPQLIGVPGELLVGGSGVCRGYLGQPALTAERFVPDPFVPGGRLYRSGDIGMWREDGTLEHLGRNDDQIQLRGYRIELGEIEAAAVEHPRICKAATVAREVGADMRLALYAVAEPASPGSVDTRALRHFLETRLPAYMIPAEITLLDDLPLTGNGKVDRRALAGLALTSAEASPRRDPVEEQIREIWQRVLGIDHVGMDDSFFEIGGHSLLLIRVRALLEEAFAISIDVVDLFRFPTIRALATHLRGKDSASSAPEPGRRMAEDDAIAIIGMAGRFPGAGNVAELWDNLCRGVESVRFFTDEELAAAGVDAAVYDQPGYVKAKATVDGMAEFDAGFFDMTPREAEITDPQHRVFLECAWQALEDAGYAPRTFAGRIGVFAGCGINGYLFENLYPNRDRLRAMGEYPLIIGNDKDYLATRVSYKLNLRGPSVSLGTACSTSLVAVDWACEALRLGKADMAIAGGVSIKVPQIDGYAYQQGGILSPDGHCRAFDARANGTIGGSGAAVVMLKPLGRALADGDHVYAVIKGSAVNNDGDDKVGFTAPSVSGQAGVIRTALARAGVDPATIEYVEAHGTGTALGDPIEIAALSEAHASACDAPCAIGSIKTNLGHLDAAAGVTGLIKAALCLDREAIPPSLNFDTPNPNIDFGRFRVATTLTPWTRRHTGQRRAAVSSFGLGGTNAHVILEEAPPRPGNSANNEHSSLEIIALSARTASALDTRARQLHRHLQANPDVELADVTYTLHRSRTTLEHRRAWVCTGREHALAALAGLDPVATIDGVAGDSAPSIAFLFAGQGAQRVGMARELYQRESVFQNAIDQVCEYASPLLGLELRSLIHGAHGGDDEGLTRTALAQPALFALEYALVRLWEHWGVVPQAMLGHSLGEYVAACVAGVFTLEEAIGLVCTRGRLMQEMPPGAMMAVPVAEQDVLSLLGDDVDLAAVNGPRQCVVAGHSDAIAAFARRLAHRHGDAGIQGQVLRTSHAFHSRAMEPIMEPFARAVARIAPRAPQIPYISNVTGRWITAEEARDPWYYARHIREPVRFDAGLSCLLDDAARVFVEVGPGATLAGLVRRRATERTVISTLEREQDDTMTVRRALARLWTLGSPVHWNGLYGDEQRRTAVPLPGYPFEKQTYWIEAKRSAEIDEVRESDSERAARRADVASWFHRPVLIPASMAAAPPTSLPGDTTWLIFADRSGLAAELADGLRERDANVYLVRPGADYAADAPGEIVIRARHPADYDRMLGRLPRGPLCVLHAWTLDSADGTGECISESGARILDHGYFSILYLGQAVERWLARDRGQRGDAAQVRLIALTSELVDVAGESRVVPEKALLLGPLRVIPQEFPALSSRIVDVVVPAAGSRARQALIGDLLVEVLGGVGASLIARRAGKRWVQSYEPVRLADARAPSVHGAALITGGLGGIGLLVAEYLAREAGMDLVLVGRTPLPERAHWDQWLSTEQPAVDAELQLAYFTAGLERALDTWAAALADVEAHLMRELAPPPPDTALQVELNALCTSHILNYFRGAGVDTTPGRKSSLDDMRQALGIEPRFHKFYELFARILAEDGVLALSGDSVEFLDRAAVIGPAETHESRIEKAYPHLRGDLAMLRHCASHYGPALRGDIEAVSVLYPEGDSALVREHSREAEAADVKRVYMGVLVQAIERLVQAAGGRRVRLLEVGAGNGFLTRMIAPVVAGRNVEYMVTDIGRSFVLAQERWADEHGFDHLDFATFDISRDPVVQGLEPLSYDLVFGLDVVHATPRIAETLEHLRHLLVPGGLLALVETVKSERWTEMIWGLAEGWWYFEDTDLRPHSPLMDLDRWDRIVGESGFDSVISYPREREARAVTECGLILAQRPQRDVPDAFFATRADQVRTTRHRIAKIRELEELGATIVTAAVDVANAEAMRAVIGQMQEHFGRLGAVIHAAGETREEHLAMPLQVVGRRQSLRQFRARVHGLRVLDELLAGHEPDIAVIISSNAAVLGGLGLTAYAAACSYMDAFAASQACSLSWVSTTWDRWPTARALERYTETRTSIDRYAMSQNECESAFARVARSGLHGQLVVSAGDLQSRIKRWIELEPTARSGADERGAASQQTAFSTPSPAQAPDCAQATTGQASSMSAVEESLVALWRDLIGVVDIGVHDNFFDLGGDSLLGTQLITRAGRMFEIELPMQLLFEHPTVAALAERVESLRAARIALASAPVAPLAEGEEEGEI